MRKPGPMQYIADPPELWGNVVDVLIEKTMQLFREANPGPADPCPPWSGEFACPLKPAEQCWGERDCWLYWAYMVAVMRTVTENAKKATDLQGKGEA